jgi:hypothetical protein
LAEVKVIIPKGIGDRRFFSLAGRRRGICRGLAAAIRRLIAPELRLPVCLYDMDRHYKAVKDKWIGFAGGLSQ